MNGYGDHSARLEERERRTGRLVIDAILPFEDGGTGSRWSAGWAPGPDALVDIDADAETLTEALVYLVYGLGETVLDLRRELAEASE